MDRCYCADPGPDGTIWCPYLRTPVNWHLRWACAHPLYHDRLWRSTGAYRIGLGDLLSSAIKWLGVQKKSGCGCTARQLFLNRLFSLPLAPVLQREAPSFGLGGAIRLFTHLFALDRLLSACRCEARRQLLDHFRWSPPPWSWAIYLQIERFFPDRLKPHSASLPVAIPRVLMFPAAGGAELSSAKNSDFIVSASAYTNRQGD